MGSIKIRDYILITLMIMLSTFEFFFRETLLINLLLIFCIPIAVYERIKLELKSLILLIAIFIILLIQAVFNHNIPIVRPLNILLPLFGVYCIAWITRKSFIKVFVNIMTVIAITSAVIYLLSLIPSVNSYLVNNLAPNFPSLNVDTAVFEGGGKNIIIYNFFANYISEAIGFPRNCGPFWEPGMFAVFLNLALFLNLNILDGHKYQNILFIIVIITTFSTGGYLGLLFVATCYFIQKRNFIALVCGITLIAFIIPIVMDLDFVGVKLLNQMDNYQVGSDDSRFGAFYTQLKMIEDNPICGGAEIESYAIKSKTLASGTLMPIVEYGLIVGGLIYLLIYNSCVNISEEFKRNKLNGVLLFGLIIVMSFSQTILTSTFFLVFLFNGLINKYAKL